jgi:hypothetical protein
VYATIVIDVVSELNYRFSDDVLSLLQLCGALSPRVNFHDWNADNIVLLANDFYLDDFKGDFDDLRDEATRVLAMASRDKRFKNLKTTHELCTVMSRTDHSALFPALYRLICLVCVLPVSTATTERAFSAMKRIKTRLRTTMGDLWMPNLMILAIERDLTNDIDKDAVIDAFSNLSSRSIPL